MELRQLRYAVTLAETLHFGRAAERLNIVQPALSMQIRALEDQLGTVLFERSRRRVALTQAGALFVAEARRSLAHADRAREIAQEAARGATGILRLGFSAGAVYSGVLRDLLDALRRSAPGLVLDAVEVHPAHAPDRILTGDLDAALGTTVSLALPPGLQRRELAAHPAVLALPCGHPLAGRDRIEPQDLRDEVFLGYTAPDDMDGTALTARILGFMPSRHRQVASPAMTIGLVAAGLGVAVVPESLWRGEPGAVLRPLAGVQARIDVSLLWQAGGNPGAHAAIVRALAAMEGGAGPAA